MGIATPMDVSRRKPTGRAARGQIVADEIMYPNRLQAASMT